MARHDCAARDHADFATNVDANGLFERYVLVFVKGVKVAIVEIVCPDRKCQICLKLDELPAARLAQDLATHDFGLCGRHRHCRHNDPTCSHARPPLLACPKPSQMRRESTPASRSCDHSP